jgi:hypothetical protein
MNVFLWIEEGVMAAVFAACGLIKTTKSREQLIPPDAVGERCPRPARRAGSSQLHTPAWSPSGDLTVTRHEEDNYDTDRTDRKASERPRYVWRPP